MSPLRIELDITVGNLALKAPFRISGRTFESVPILTVEVSRGGVRGRGEAAGVYYLNDTPATMEMTLRSVANDIKAGITRDELRQLLPTGGARNAIDCALWELESHEQGRGVWALGGVPELRPLLTTQTLSAEAPEFMQTEALRHRAARALKLKLTGETDLDIARVRAVRAVRPDVWLGVDANQGYVPSAIEPLIATLMDCRVSLLEQPFRRGHDAELDDLNLPLMVAADESCQNLTELEKLAGRFDVVNIKLDKCGGLTEGLLIARRAEELGMKVMVGNMTGTSLAMAPGFVVGQLCDVVDLDGPTFLSEDPFPHVTYDEGYIWCPPEVWGYCGPSRHGAMV